VVVGLARSASGVSLASGAKLGVQALAKREELAAFRAGLPEARREVVDAAASTAAEAVEGAVVVELEARIAVVV
jgi:hypothetical protein